MYGLINTLPVSPPPVVGSVALNRGSFASVRAASEIPLTAAVVSSGWPDESTRVNVPVSTKPPSWFDAVAVTGVLVTCPTNAPAGMPVPVTAFPASVATIALSAIVELPADAVALASVRGPGGLSPPPSRHVPAGCAGTVCATQLLGRSTNPLYPGPGYSSLPLASLASGVLGPV